MGILEEIEAKEKKFLERNSELHEKSQQKIISAIISDPRREIFVGAFGLYYLKDGNKKILKNFERDNRLIIRIKYAADGVYVRIDKASLFKRFLWFFTRR